MPRDSIETLSARRPINRKAPEMPSLKSLLGKDYTEKLAYSFPDVVPPYLPCGKNILVQLRTPGNYKILANGQKFFFADESVDYDKMNMQTCIVRALGPVAYRHRLTMETFPEGEWCVPGEFMRVPKFGGDRVGVPINDEQKRTAYFVMINDTDAVGQVYGDPLALQGII